LKSLNLPFYLTGGTAVSRGYFHHRYSDDLDLFVNRDNNFLSHVEQTLNSLEKAGFSIKVSESSSPDFTRIYVNQNLNGLNKNGLKIDFVNDIDVHFGNIQKTDVYYRTDSLRNIISNKYTALYRLSVKDVVDICEISKHCAFDWKTIVDEANEKEVGVDLKEVVEIFKSFSDSNLMSVKWANKPDITELRKNIEQIAQDMILLQPNSLCKDYDIKKITFNDVGEKYVSEIIKQVNLGKNLSESISLAEKSFSNIKDNPEKIIEKNLLNTFKKVNCINTEKDLSEFLKNNKSDILKELKKSRDDDYGGGR
jgi:hypothetical protein